MNFLNIHYFLMVAQERSFTRAAERLYITQQTLSAQIASIEQELGCKLFQRKIPLELTYEGRIFLNYAEEFSGKYEEMQQEFGEISGNQKGCLRIGIAYTREHALMPKILKEYQEKYPNIEIQLVEDLNDILQQKLLKGEIDLAIAGFLTPLNEVQVRDFYEEEVVLLVGKELLYQLYGDRVKQVVQKIREEKKVTPLEKCPFLMNGQKDIAGRIGRHLIAQAGFTPDIRVEGGNIETLLELCAKNMGACFSPKILAQAVLSEKQLSKMFVFHFPEDTWYWIRFAWLKQSYAQTLITHFIEITEKSCFET